jgi:Tfp pilus assembly major pilin PilA
VTPADIAILTGVMGPIVREFTAKAVSEAVAPVLARNAELELRVLELETVPRVAMTGEVGPQGAKGDPGPSISTLTITAEGRLLAHLTDGRSLDAGPVRRVSTARMAKTALTVSTGKMAHLESTAKMGHQA